MEKQSYNCHRAALRRGQRQRASKGPGRISVLFPPTASLATGHLFSNLLSMSRLHGYPASNDYNRVKMTWQIRVLERAPKFAGRALM